MLEQAIYKNIKFQIFRKYNFSFNILTSSYAIYKGLEQKRIYEHDFVTIINQMLFPIVFKASFLFFTKLKVNPQKDVMAVKYHF